MGTHIHRELRDLRLDVGPLGKNAAYAFQDDHVHYRPDEDRLITVLGATGNNGLYAV